MYVCAPVCQYVRKVYTNQFIPICCSPYTNCCSCSAHGVGPMLAAWCRACCKSQVPVPEQISCAQRLFSKLLSPLGSSMCNTYKFEDQLRHWESSNCLVFCGGGLLWLQILLWLGATRTRGSAHIIRRHFQTISGTLGFKIFRNSW